MKFSFFIYPQLYILLTIVFYSCSKTVDEWQVEETDIIEEDLILNNQSEYIIVLGDIQIYTSQIAALKYLRQTMDWINAQNKYGKNINCILQVGDITNNNSYTHWEHFYDCTYQSNDILYIACTGNHDYDWDSNGKINDRNSTHINDFASFPLTKLNIIDYFEPGKIENVVIANSIHGERLDIIVLEFGPREEVLDWINKYVAEHQGVRYILMTHEFLTRDGKRISKNSYAEQQLRNTTWSSPEQIWEKVVSKNDNILCVLCGHSGFTAHLFTKNDYNRDVPQVLFNLQFQENGGDGMIQLWEFPEKSDSASVKVYNTIKREFHPDSSTSFKFRYRY